MPAAGRELGDAGRDHQAPRTDPRDRLAGLIGIGAEAVPPRLLVAVERLGEHRDPESHFTCVMPYHPGTTRRSGNPC